MLNRIVKNLNPSSIKFRNQQLVKNTVGDKIHAINQLKVKGTNKTLEEEGGIINIENILLDNELSKFGLLKFGASIYDSYSIIKIEINQENANGIKAILSTNLFDITNKIKQEGLLEKIESIINPQESKKLENIPIQLITKQTRDKQDKSYFTAIPFDIRDYIFSFLDNPSLSRINNTCTLFYNDSKSRLDSNHKRMLNDCITDIEEKISEVENDLRKVNGKIGYGLNGYFFQADRSSEITHQIDIKLRYLVPKLREAMLSIFYNVKLLAKRDIHMEKDFSDKLEALRTRFDNCCGKLSSFDFSKIDHQVEAEIQSERQQFYRRS